MTEPVRLGQAIPIIATRGRPSALRQMIARSGAPMYHVAGLSGIDPSTMSKYANRRMPIRHHHMLSLCTLFECEPEDLLDEYDEE
jgi:DNA-binding Xre family transcriptional regulator